MKEKTKGVCIILSVLVIFGLSGCSVFAPSYEQLKEGQKARTFLVETNKGTDYELTSKPKKPVLITFWATWCKACCKELPALEKIYEEYDGQIDVLAINASENKEDVDKFIESNQYQFTVCYDEKGEISEKYPGEGLPYTILIDTDGNIKTIFVGSLGEEKQYNAYRRVINELLER